MRWGIRQRAATAGRLLPASLRPAAVALLAACVAVTAGLALRFAGQRQAGRLDAAVDTAVRSGLGAFPALLGFLARVGTLVPVSLMTAALILASMLTRRWSGAVLALAVPVASGLTEWVLKPLVGRTMNGVLSFPSGHATSMFALAAVSAILLLDPPGRRVPGAARLVLALLALLAASAVAAAMVALGSHYFTDAVAGAAVGTGTVLACAVILDRVTARRRDRPYPE